MEKVFTVSHKVIVPTDFTGFVSLLDMERTAILFDLMSTVDKQDKKINLLHKRIKTLEMASRPQEQGIEPPLSDIVDTAKPVDIVKVASTGEKGNGGGTIGQKLGKRKYHYVGIQERNKKFDSFRAGTTIDGKSVGMGTSKNEIECALGADLYLDGIGDTKRPRNYKDFPEVAEALIVKTEGKKVADAVAKNTGGSE